MLSADQKLPNFDSPPVVETVLSVQFEKLPVMQSVHFGLFWQRVRNRFPKTEDKPALPHVIEAPDQSPSSGAKLRFEAIDSMTIQRLWLLDRNETEMMQVQNDRFIKNWRKNEANPHYPRYKDFIKPAFEKDFALFNQFVEEEKLGHLKINQCEITYVNHILAGDGWDSPSELDKIFNVWNGKEIAHFPGKPAEVGFKARFPIEDGSKWLGWLHIDVQPAVRKSDNRQMYVMNLTARGMAGNNYDFFDIGRAWIVNSFANLTTPRMHEIWRKK